MTTPPMTAADFLRGVTPEFREELLCELLAEVVRHNGGTSPVPIHSLDGRAVGYFYSPVAVEELFRQHGPTLTPDDLAEIDRRLDHLNEAVPIEQALSELRAMAVSPRKQPA